MQSSISAALGADTPGGSAAACAVASAKLSCSKS